MGESYNGPNLALHLGKSYNLPPFILRFFQQLNLDPLLVEETSTRWCLGYSKRIVLRPRQEGERKFRVLSPRPQGGYDRNGRLGSSEKEIGLYRNKACRKPPHVKIWTSSRHHLDITWTSPGRHVDVRHLWLKSGWSQKVVLAGWLVCWLAGWLLVGWLANPILHSFRRLIVLEKGK